MRAMLPLSEGEGQFNRDDHRDRLAHPRARGELPHPGGLDGYYPDLNNAGEVTTNAQSITVGAASAVIFEWAGMMRDVEVTYTTGTFTMYVS